MRGTTYEIRIEGYLGPDWFDWFEGFSVREASGGQTVLIGTIPDQAALHGVLKRVRDAGLPLISLHIIDYGV